MKRVGFLFQRVVAFPNLPVAARKARKGKRYRAPTVTFEFGLEHELLRLRDELVSGSHEPGPYRQFTIREPKPWLISAAP